MFVTTAAAAPGGTFTNTATVSAATSDPVPANNSASQNTTISVSADLAVTKTDGVASVVAGTSTDYTITLTNNGPSAVAAGVVVSDPIPAGTVGSETEPNCAIAAGTFTCTTTAVLASGASVVYHLIAGRARQLRARHGRQHGDHHVGAGDGSRRLPTTRPRTPTPSRVGGPRDRRRPIGVDPVVAGTSITYTITVTNNGPSDEPTGVAGLRHGARAVHRDERDLARPALRDRVGNVVTCTPAALAAAASWSSSADAWPAEPRGAARHLHEHRDRRRAADRRSGARQRLRRRTPTDRPVGRPLDREDRLRRAGRSRGRPRLHDHRHEQRSVGRATTSRSPTRSPAPGPSRSPGWRRARASCGNSATTSRACWRRSPRERPGRSPISVLLDPSTPGGLYTNTADVTSTTFDPDAANDTDTRDRRSCCRPPTWSSPRTTALPRSWPATSTTYTITLTNDGPSTELAGVVVSDPIPAGHDRHRRSTPIARSPPGRSRARRRPRSPRSARSRTSSR